MAILKPSPSPPSRKRSGMAHVLEEERAGARGPDADLVVRLAAGEALRRRSGTRKALIPLCPFALSVMAKTRTTSACGPLVMKFLVPFEDVLVALLHRHGAHLGGVGAARGLGEREGAELLARGRRAPGTRFFCSSVPNL